MTYTAFWSHFGTIRLALLSQAEMYQWAAGSLPEAAGGVMSAGFQAFGRCFFSWGGFSKLPQVGENHPKSIRYFIFGTVNWIQFGCSIHRTSYETVIENHQLWVFHEVLSLPTTFNYTFMCYTYTFFIICYTYTFIYLPYIYNLID